MNRLPCDRSADPAQPQLDKGLGAMAQENITCTLLGSAWPAALSTLGLGLDPQLGGDTACLAVCLRWWGGPAP